MSTLVEPASTDRRREESVVAQQAPSDALDQAHPTTFISYAREDQAFVRQMAAALEREGILPRADWQLVPGEDYARSLRLQMLGADALLFVISPDSVASAECRRELAFAVEHKKRILPVCRRPHGDDASLDSSIRSPQWTFMREGDDFNAGIRELTTAIRTDFDLMDLHSRLLTNSSTWTENGRNRSYLLQRDELKAAEEWLKRASAQPGKLPQPTPLQLEYIFASQADRTRQTRWKVGLASVVAVALAILAVIAMLQGARATQQSEIARQNESKAVRNAEEASRQTALAQNNEREAVRQRTLADVRREEADQQRNIASTQRDLAQSRQLAAVSQSQGDADPELAVLLAMEAWQRSPTGEAEHALRQALSKSHARQVLRAAAPADDEDGDYVNHAMFSHDGKFILSAHGDGVARMWDASTGRPGRSFAVSEFEETFFSPRGTFVGANLRDPERTRIWRADSGALVFEARGHIGDSSFTSDESLLVTTATEDSSGVWEVKTGRLVRPLPSGVAKAFFSGGGKLLVTVGADRVVVADAGSGRQVTVIEGGAAAAVTPDGNVIVTCGSDARVWSTQTGELIHTLRGQCDTLVISADGRVLATADEDSEAGVVDVWDLEEGERLSRVRGSLGPAGAGVFTPDGNLLVTAMRDSTAVVWDTGSGEVQAVLRGHAQKVNSATFDARGRRIVTASDDGDVRVWEVSGTFLVSKLHVGNIVRAVSLSPPADRLVSGEDTGASLWQVATPKELVSWSGGPGAEQVNAVAFSADGTTLIAGGAGPSVLVMDTASGRTVASLPSRPVSIVALNADGRLALTVSGTAATTWDTRGARRLTTFSTHRQIAAAFLDGTRVMTLDATGALAWWESRTGRALSPHRSEPRLPPVGEGRLQEPLLAATGVGSGAQSTPTRTNLPRLLALGDGPLVRVWDVALRRVNVVLKGHTGDITSVAFDRSGRFVVTGSDDTTVRIWDATTGRTVAMLTGHTEMVNAAMFSPDGTMVASGGFDETVRVSKCEVCVDVASLLGMAKSRVTRALTEAERQEYLKF
jgi:WD40 repeat protein